MSEQALRQIAKVIQKVDSLHGDLGVLHGILRGLRGSYWGIPRGALLDAQTTLSALGVLLDGWADELTPKNKGASAEPAGSVPGEPQAKREERPQELA